MMTVDDFSRFKVRKSLKVKSSIETVAALESYIVTYTTPEQVGIPAPFVSTTEASLRGNFRTWSTGHTAPGHAA